MAGKKNSLWSCTTCGWDCKGPKCTTCGRTKDMALAEAKAKDAVASKTLAPLNKTDTDAKKVADAKKIVDAEAKKLPMRRKFLMQMQKKLLMQRRLLMQKQKGLQMRRKLQMQHLHPLLLWLHLLLCRQLHPSHPKKYLWMFRPKSCSTVRKR